MLKFQKKFDKYAIYSHFGTTDAVDSYLYERPKRKGNSEELKNWLQEIEVVEKYNTELAKKMHQILNPLLSKFTSKNIF